MLDQTGFDNKCCVKENDQWKFQTKIKIGMECMNVPGVNRCDSPLVLVYGESLENVKHLRMGIITEKWDQITAEEQHKRDIYQGSLAKSPPPLLLLRAIRPEAALAGDCFDTPGNEAMCP